MADVQYIKGAELPDGGITWNDAQAGLIDFSTNWTFSAFIGQVGQPADLVKTTGITGSANAPNVIFAWAADELDGLTPGEYTVDVEALNTISSKSRKRRFTMEIIDSVRPAVP